MPQNPVDADNHSVDIMSRSESPKASLFEFKSSISILSGDGPADHLNNILTGDVSKLADGERVDALVCDSNGRVRDVLSCFGVGNEIIVLGIYENLENTRSLLTAGIPWNKDLILYDGNDALRHCVVHGEEALELVGLLYPELSEIPENKFVSIVSISIKDIIYKDAKSVLLPIFITKPLIALIQN